MSRNVVFGVGAVALAGAALVVLLAGRGDDGSGATSPAPGDEEATRSASAAPIADGAVARPTAEQRLAARRLEAARQRAKAEEEDLEEVEAVVVVAKEAFDDAIAQLEDVDVAADPAGVARAVREVELAFARLEMETDPENPIHRRIHDRATQQLEERLSVIAGPRGPKAGYPEPEG